MDRSRPDAPRRWPIVVTVLVIGVLAVGSVMGRSGRGETSAEPAAVDVVSNDRSTSDGVDRGSGSAAVEADVAGGFARSEAGAQAAGLSWARASQTWFYLDAAALEAAVRAITAPARQERVLDVVVAELAVLRAALAARPAVQTWWAVAPLAVRLDSFDGDRSEVSVWTVRLFSQVGIADPQVSWATLGFEMVWDGDARDGRGDWRLWSTAESPGPSAMVAPGEVPVTAAEFDELMTGFGLADPAQIVTATNTAEAGER